MTLAVGTRLGPYEVLAPLGAGGMGEVYRARDSKLNRDVALKILPEVFALDPDRLARFKREAQVLASLNHPNIAAIYGLEDSELVQALVLELVEGPTLADRIGQGAIPMQEALSIARQIAEALETAREQGVVHRDLKPANIKLRPDGMVKVLDFGLAKLAQPADSRLQTSDLSESPTVTSPAATRVGMIMGTAAYMSPEQARGMPVDNRTDIWAFGCVLYEMLGGQAAFAAETMSDTIARILEREPDWRVLPASTPATIRHLLGRCLQKDQHRRLHDIADARIEIEEARTAASGRRSRVGLPIVAVGVALVMTLLAGAWWYPRQPISAAPHAPVSVLIADFRNDTNDPIFDRTLEPLLRLVLEGAGFITAYDRTGVRALGGPAVETLDEQTAQEIAVKQGVGVVVSGSLNRDGNSYWISVKATQPVTGNVIASATNRASGKDGVLAAATNLATTVRTALGDETSDSTSQIFAMDTLSATNLEVVRQYAVATEAMSRATFEEALQGFSKSVELDPGFGMGYQGMALASRNLDRQEDAEKYIKEALRHLDRMTERERFRARGFFYRVTGDYQACVKEYGDLIARYAADVAARNQIALCSTFLRDMPRAVDEMQRVVKIVPRSTIFRNNLAVYLAYSGNYKAAEQEARAIESPSVTSLIALAFGQLGQGRVPQAIETYQKLQTIGAQGASRAISGLGDVAMYEGRFAEAVRILDQGAAADAAAKEPDRAAAKFAALAYAQLLRRQNTGAIAASKSALQSSQIVKIRFLAGRTLAEAGDISGAQTVAASLASELQAEPQALAKIIEGLIALKRGEAQQAIKLLNEANGLVDTWIGHFDLGRAYLEVGQYIQADSEFDRSVKRRGEALSLFLDEHPTYGYFPAVYYYQGRVRESMNSAGFAASYREYLNIRGNSSDDPLVPEVRRRVRP